MATIELRWSFAFHLSEFWQVRWNFSFHFAELLQWRWNFACYNAVLRQLRWNFAFHIAEFRQLRWNFGFHIAEFRLLRSNFAFHVFVPDLVFFIFWKIFVLALCACFAYDVAISILRLGLLHIIVLLNLPRCFSVGQWGARLPLC